MAEKKKKKELDSTSLARCHRGIGQDRGSGIETAYDRYLNMQPQCNFGEQGVCCHVCILGPCRTYKKASKGICGAPAYTIVGRNLVRSALGGCAAHSDHGLHATL